MANRVSVYLLDDTEIHGSSAAIALEAYGVRHSGSERAVRVIPWHRVAEVIIGPEDGTWERTEVAQAVGDPWNRSELG